MAPQIQVCLRVRVLGRKPIVSIAQPQVETPVMATATPRMVQGPQMILAVDIFVIILKLRILRIATQLTTVA